MVVAIALGHVHVDAKEFGQAPGRQEFPLGTVAKDSSVPEEYHAVDLRNDIGKLMRY